MGKRVNVDGPGDDPDEYWFECDDCEGTGRVSIPDEDEGDDGVYVEATCPGCDGLGVIEGDADDVDGWTSSFRTARDLRGRPRVGKRNIPGDGWSKEGEAWFDSLDWEDAQFLLTRQGDDPRTEEDEERLTRLRESYESATGETWE